MLSARFIILVYSGMLLIGCRIVHANVYLKPEAQQCLEEGHFRDSCPDGSRLNIGADGSTVECMQCAHLICGRPTQSTKRLCPDESAEFLAREKTTSPAESYRGILTTRSATKPPTTSTTTTTTNAPVIDTGNIDESPKLVCLTKEQCMAERECHGNHVTNTFNSCNGYYTLTVFLTLALIIACVFIAILCVIVYKQFNKIHKQKKLLLINGNNNLTTESPGHVNHAPVGLIPIRQERLGDDPSQQEPLLPAEDGTSSTEGPSFDSPTDTVVDIDSSDYSDSMDSGIQPEVGGEKSETEPTVPPTSLPPTVETEPIKPTGVIQPSVKKSPTQRSTKLQDPPQARDQSSGQVPQIGSHQSVPNHARPEPVGGNTDPVNPPEVGDVDETEVMKLHKCNDKTKASGHETELMKPYGGRSSAKSGPKRKVTNQGDHSLRTDGTMSEGGQYMSGPNVQGNDALPNKKVGENPKEEGTEKMSNECTEETTSPTPHLPPAIPQIGPPQFNPVPPPAPIGLQFPPVNRPPPEAAADPNVTGQLPVRHQFPPVNQPPQEAAADPNVTGRPTINPQFQPVNQPPQGAAAILNMTGPPPVHRQFPPVNQQPQGTDAIPPTGPPPVNRQFRPMNQQPQGATADPNETETVERAMSGSLVLPDRPGRATGGLPPGAGGGAVGGGPPLVTHPQSQNSNRTVPTDGQTNPPPNLDHTHDSTTGQEQS